MAISLKNARRQHIGFTLIELMIVVAVIGLLAAVAIPAFLQYQLRAKTAEAAVNIKGIADGATAYFTRDIGGAASRLPATVGYTPAAPPPSSSKYAIATYASEFLDGSNTSARTWLALGWAPHVNFYYVYSFEQSCGTAPCPELATATVRAQGDLDNDTDRSTFSRTLTVRNNYLVAADLVRVNALE